MKQLSTTDLLHTLSILLTDRQDCIKLKNIHIKVIDKFKRQISKSFNTVKKYFSSYRLLFFCFYNT